MQKISVVGLGYIGLPTAAVFASRGVEVIGVDVNPATVATINRGEIHIVEPRLDEIVKRVVSDGFLRATTTPEPADAFLIAVPTPFKDGKAPDLDYVERACRSIAPVLKQGDVVILESTSPVGTTERMAAWLREVRPDLRFPGARDGEADVAVAYCPERVLPGNVLHELVHNDRVIGGLSPRCSESATEVYRLIVEADCIVTTARTAELCKLTENSFRDVNIAFANELSVICDKLGIDVWELVALANRHPRVNVLQPGPGVGGHCIAVDPWFIVDSAPEEARMIRMAREVNDAKPHWVVGKVAEAAGAERDVTIACMGLAYKPDVDDLRESPSVEITLALARAGLGSVRACEPFIESLPHELAEAGVDLVSTDRALEADLIVFLTPHAQFRAIETDRLEGKRIVDACGFARRHATRIVRPI